ncbi:MAG TPA: hypothetical protein PLL05_07635, partial [Muribaculaceae bacterium]|nr:hypothetical protein [Muribaculaceae bacterium]
FDVQNITGFVAAVVKGKGEVQSVERALNLSAGCAADAVVFDVVERIVVDAECALNPAFGFFGRRRGIGTVKCQSVFIAIIGTVMDMVRLVVRLLSSS